MSYGDRCYEEKKTRYKGESSRRCYFVLSAGKGNKQGDN